MGEGSALKRRAGADSRGFTLIELLLVIVILGILTAIVVLAVNGLQDRGQNAACAADRRTLETAEGVFFAQPLPNGGAGTYVTETVLAAHGFLQAASTLHDVTVAPDQKSFTIVGLGPCAST